MRTRTSLVIAALSASALLSVVGCKKEEKAATPAPGKQEPVIPKEAPKEMPKDGPATEPAKEPPPASATSTKAIATLEPRSGSKITGDVVIVEKDGGVSITVRIANATPGKHGAHLHETGDCSAADAKSAGGHFNPDKMEHGAPDKAPHHNGDLGNIEVGADGTGTLTIDDKDLTLAAGPKSVLGRAVIVHADPDDMTTQPAGNAGARAACGVITNAP